MLFVTLGRRVTYKQHQRTAKLLIHIARREKKMLNILQTQKCSHQKIFYRYRGELHKFSD